ncbi:MAG: hybrid sensor histidine kinase/response regulator [Chloroflexi bacterium]|nr:hybrid sensor histidine kinase/response regulator [Chloroflexota bacterium]
MALNEDFLRQLRATFAAEAQEHIQVINRDLLAFEREPDSASVDQWLADIFRAAHSLKGAARAVNEDTIGTLAHRLETLFGHIRDRSLQLTPEVFDLAYQALDALSALVQAMNGGPAATVDTAALVAALEAVGQPTLPKAGAEPSGGTAPAKASTPEHEHTSARGVEPSGGASPAKASTPEHPKAPAPAPRPTAPITEETIRMTTSKLDALMAQVGELQVTRLGAEQRLSELTALLDGLEAWEVEWRKLRPHVMADFRAEAADLAPQVAAAAPGKRAATAARVLGYLESSETRLHAAAGQLRELRRRFVADNRRMAQVVSDLEEDVRRTRMMPVSTVFETFPRMVRDLARDLGKQARLVVQGGEVEVDRSVLEQIKDPLTHLLRNAVDHGVESPPARAAAGKPAEGVITLAAAQRGDSITIEISDDGAGIDLKAVRTKAVAKGLLRPDEAETLSDREALWLIFSSGLSTSDRVTDLSGRGVGLDVVRENIERLHGIIDVDNRQGRGTRFTLSLPLTVATTLCLLAQAGSQVFALPVSNVVRIVRLRPEGIGRAEGREAITLDDRPMPLVRLGEVLGMSAPLAPQPFDQLRAGSGGKPGCSHSQAAAGAASQHLPVVILGSAERRVAFTVDALVGVREVVIKSLPKPLLRVRYTAGATILGTGEVVIVLNVADLLRATGRPRSVAVAATAKSTPGADETRREAATMPTVIVCDDSFTTRTLEKNILESAGYPVRVAADGLEAWNLLQSEGADVLVSDISMPRMDGFELAAKVRSDERFKHLPVILITSLESREDRERGIQAGADAYIVKSAFDQESLLNTIRRLI